MKCKQLYYNMTENKLQNGLLCFIMFEKCRETVDVV